jgi:hypothetical protein
VGGDFKTYTRFTTQGIAEDLIVIDDKGEPIGQTPPRAPGLIPGPIDQIDVVDDPNQSTRFVRALGHLSAQTPQPVNGLLSFILDGRVSTSFPLGVNMLEGPWPPTRITNATAIAGAPDGTVYLARPDSAGQPTISQHTSSGDLIRVIAQGDAGEVRRLLLSRDGRILYVGGTFRRLRVPGRQTINDLFTAIRLSNSAR